MIVLNLSTLHHLLLPTDVSINVSPLELTNHINSNKIFKKIFNKDDL